MAIPAGGDAASTSEHGDARASSGLACMTSSRSNPSSQIPAASRERLVAPARQRLTNPINWPDAVLPVTADGWIQSLTDAGLNGIDRLLSEEFDALLDPVNLTDTGGLRRTSTQMAERAADVLENLTCLATMSPPEATEAADLGNALLSAVFAAFDHLSGRALPDDVQRSQAAMNAALDRLRSVSDTYAFPADTCEAAFGVPYEQLLDGNGIFSPPRLLSSYYGRYDELARRLSSLLSAVTTDPPDLLNAVAPAEALVLTSHPLVALRTARRVRDLIEQQFATDPDRIAGILRKQKLAVDRSAASHAAMVRLLQQIEQADTAAERAHLKLDFYRRMVEGQLRPWAWSLLQIVGRSASRVPEVSSLHEQLVSEGTPLLLDAAAAILPEARNASAHEDYLWDEELEVLHVGEAIVNVEDLETAADLAYTFMAGAECAWRCSRTTLPELARLLDSEDPPSGLRAIRERAALEHFGTNGLNPQRWSHESRRLTVVLDELPHRSVDPCFQAAIWASRHLESVERVIVQVQNGSITAMDLPRSALDANFLVWNEARAMFNVMPGSTFLVTNAAARLAVESPAEAARAVTWLALNDVMHAYIDGAEGIAPIRDRVVQLAARLQLAVVSLSTTALTLPETAVSSPLYRALDLLVPAASWAASAARGLSPGPSGQLQRQIERLYDDLPVVALLPTIDRNPMV
jgi:hypothetical protein